MTAETAPSASRCVLVGIQTPGMTEADLQSSLDELARLASTLGLNPVARLTQQRSGTGSAVLLGDGKLKELAKLTGGTGVVPLSASRRQTGTLPREAEEEVEPQEDDGDTDDPDDVPAPPKEELCTVVIADCDLSPNQLRKLEAATGAQVLDRSSVILGIFQRHARTREAKLQVEIARLAYLAPRLRATGGSADRQRGGIGGRGAGESAIELDRRRARDRIAELRAELELVKRESDVRRARRGSTDTVALVGYTNAGKSSLMRALTGSDILIADQLFATLDTTVRVLLPETRPRILVSDTVGFIKKLPHDLVASFRSTLEEARDAALLLHVVDASDPAWRDQLAVTRMVLAELGVSEAGRLTEHGAEETPVMIVLNKIDRVDAETRDLLALEMPEAFQMSALRPADVASLHDRIVSFFEREMDEIELLVSWPEHAMVNAIHESCRVLEEEHLESGTRLKVRGPRAILDKLRVDLTQG